MIRNLARLRTVDPSLVRRRRDALYTIATYVLGKGYVIKGGFVRDMIIHSGLCSDIDICSGIDCNTEAGKVELHAKMKLLIDGIVSDIPLITTCCTEIRTQYLVSIKLTHKLFMNWQIEVQFLAGMLQATVNCNTTINKVMCIIILWST